MKTIGILGGMGPEATAQLYLRIIRIFQTRFGARDDADFPSIFICNLPLPDVVGNIDTSTMVRDCLVLAAKKLKSVGCDFIAVPCNTISYFLQDIRSSVLIPVLSIPEEVALILSGRSLQKVGVLGTAMTIRTNLYEIALPELEMVVPNSEEVDTLTSIILNVLSGKKTKEDETVLLTLIESLKSRGAETIILGCTELPLLISGKDDVIDTLDVLAEAVVKMTIA